MEVDQQETLAQILASFVQGYLVHQSGQRDKTK